MVHRFWTRAPRRLNGERMVFSTNINGTNGYLHAKEQSWTPYSIPRTKINLKWTKEHNLRAKTIKQLEENTDINLCDLVFGNIFKT